MTIIPKHLRKFFSKNETAHWGALVGALVGLIIALAAHSSKSVAAMEEDALNAVLAVCSAFMPPIESRAIYVVDVNDAIGSLEESAGHRRLAALLETIEDAEPAAIVLDVDLNLHDGQKPDERLAAFFRRFDNVVLAFENDRPPNHLLPDDYDASRLLKASPDLLGDGSRVIMMQPATHVAKGRFITYDSGEIGSGAKTLSQAALEIYARREGSNVDRWHYPANSRQYAYPGDVLLAHLSPADVIGRTTELKGKLVIVGHASDVPSWPSGAINAHLQALAIASRMENRVIVAFASWSAFAVAGAVLTAIFSSLPVSARLIALFSSGVLYLGAIVLCVQFFQVALPPISGAFLLLGCFAGGSIVDSLRNYAMFEIARARSAATDNTCNLLQWALHNEAVKQLRDLRALVERARDNHNNSDMIPELEAGLAGLETTLRHRLWELYPSTIAEADILDLLKTLLDHAVQRSIKNAREMEWDFRRPADRSYDFSQEQKLAIFRIMQELISNVERHSKAHTVILNVEESKSGMLRISLIDDGIGLKDTVEPGTTQGTTAWFRLGTQKVQLSYGRKLLQAAAQDLGGKISWRKPQQFASGTEVMLEIPLPVSTLSREKP